MKIEILKNAANFQIFYVCIIFNMQELSTFGTLYSKVVVNPMMLSNDLNTIHNALDNLAESCGKV